MSNGLTIRINALLIILEHLNGKCDFHKLFKILYFADQKHLVKYGTPILGDKYIAMKHGPVPSSTYDFLKHLKSTRASSTDDIFSVTDNHIVLSNQKADLDDISESAVECLIESIIENKDLSFSALTDKSHKEAWNKAKDQTEEIDFVDIASEGGANEEMLKYINLNFENQCA